MKSTKLMKEQKAMRENAAAVAHAPLLCLLRNLQIIQNGYDQMQKFVSSLVYFLAWLNRKAVHSDVTEGHET